MESIIMLLGELLGLLVSVITILFIGGAIFFIFGWIADSIKCQVEENKLKKEHKKGYDEGYSAAFDLIDDWDKAKKSYRPWR